MPRSIAVEIEAEITTYVCQFNYCSFPLIKSCMVHRFFILLGLLAIIWNDCV